jgi:hypothetical protein
VLALYGMTKLIFVFLFFLLVQKRTKKGRLGEGIFTSKTTLKTSRRPLDCWNSKLLSVYSDAKGFSDVVGNVNRLYDLGPK